MALTLFYGDAPEREREVASFVRNTHPREGDTREWLYHSRGGATEAITALRGVKPGFIGGIGGFPPEDVRLILDDSGFEDSKYRRDTPDLCWGGPRLTVPEFSTWYWGQS